MAGAAAVQVGTANFLDPKACTRITSEINQWMDAHGVKTLEEAEMPLSTVTMSR